MGEVPKDILKDIFNKVNPEDTFARLIQMKLIEVEPGYARSVILITDETVNIYQMAHGGATCSVADQACEAAGKVTNRSNRIGLIEPRS